MTRFYFDASGSPDNPNRPIFAIGGFIASVSQWETFSKSWNQILEESDAPIYHATDCEPSNNGRGWGEFSEWDKSLLETLKNKLIPLVSGLTAGYGVALDARDFDVELRHFPLCVKRLSDKLQWEPLSFLSECVISWICRVCAEIKGEANGNKVDIFFEAGSPNIGQAIDHALWLKKKFPQHTRFIGAMVGGGEKSLPAMQIADMLAFETYKAMECRMKDPTIPLFDYPKERYVLKELARHNPRIHIKRMDKESYSILKKAYEEWPISSV